MSTMSLSCFICEKYLLTHTVFERQITIYYFGAIPQNNEIHYFGAMPKNNEFHYFGVLPQNNKLCGY